MIEKAHGWHSIALMLVTGSLGCGFKHAIPARLEVGAPRRHHSQDWKPMAQLVQQWLNPQSAGRLRQRDRLECRATHAAAGRLRRGFEPKSGQSPSGGGLGGGTRSAFLTSQTPAPGWSLAF